MVTRGTGGSAGPIPRRGQVWRDDHDREYLILSVDEFNSSRMDDVIAVAVDIGDTTGDDTTEGDTTEGDTTPYATVLEVAGELRTIFSDNVFVVPKASLQAPVWAAGEELMDTIASDLDAILTHVNVPYSANRPRTFPRPGAIRFAELYIEGQREKPVVVISSEQYARKVGYAFVLACRVTSNPVNVRPYDVSLGGQRGKVVCSHVQIVSNSDLRERSPQDARQVSAGQAGEILRKVRRLLGIEAS